MNMIAMVSVGATAVLFLYTYVGYPVILRFLARGHNPVPPEIPDWPLVSISLPVHNEESQIRGVLESILQLEYPAEKLQVLVISDASTDRTDQIVAEYETRGIELLRLPERGGKGAAEAAGAYHLSGDIVVNTDASVRIRPDALKPLIAQFHDASVGVASGRDISVARFATDANFGELGYVDYEMWLRKQESILGGIVGASGCFYAIRAGLHRQPLPNSLSRDFAAALIAREHGFRAVSVDDAVCLVPRTSSLQREYRRKVRTITRGLETLWYKRHLLNPSRYGSFAWMLFSHKICRWLVPWAVLFVISILAVAGISLDWARWTLLLVGLGTGWASVGWMLSDRPQLPRALALPAFVLAGNIAALHASIRALRGDENSIWEPTRRDAVVLTDLT